MLNNPMIDHSSPFPPFLKQADKPRFVVAEITFRSALKFLDRWMHFERTSTPDQHLHYYAIEKNPLSIEEIQKQIGQQSSEFCRRLEKLAALYPMRIEGWHTLRLSPQVTFTLAFGDVIRELPQLQTPVDEWILNDTEPSEILFQNIKRLSQSGTYVSSIVATDAIQNGLRETGFTIHTDKGTTTGILTQGPTPFMLKKSRPEKVAVIGGGIAGASLAYTLSTRGCDITLFEKNGLASGGSGNDRGLCNPRLSAGKGPEADFYSPAFNLAHRLFAELSQTDDIGFKACGSLHMIFDDNKDKRYHGFKKNWGWHDDHARIISAAESSDTAGVKILQPSLYLAGAGMVSPKKATFRMAASAKIVMRDVSRIEEDGSAWRIDGEDFDCVILAGSFDVLKFPYTCMLPIEKVRGQVTSIRTTPVYNQLQTNLCYGGYASVAEQGTAILGSTFQTWIDDPALRPEDDLDNIDKLKAVAPHIAEGLSVTGGRASFRSAAKDRAPVIGPIHGVENLYISTAHGSHGILSSIMGAEYLTSKIMGDAQILPRSVERFLSPSRFKLR